MNEEICVKCPLGPEPLKHMACQRCVADVAALQARDAFIDTYRQRLFYDGMFYGDVLKYDLLNNFLPDGDPGAPASAHP